MWYKTHLTWESLIIYSLMWLKVSLDLDILYKNKFDVGLSQIYHTYFWSASNKNWKRAANVGLFGRKGS